MATVKVKSEGKSGFLKEYFVDHPDAGKATIDEAWQEAGNEDTISDSLIYKVRHELSLTGKGRSKTKASGKVGAGKGSSAASKASPGKTGTTAKTNGRHVTESVGRSAETWTKGDDHTQVMIRLEAQIDEMLHEIKLAGGLPEFEETLRKARRILVRSYEE